MHLSTKIRNSRGLTLLEVMIAMVILSVALLMLLNMAMVAVDGNDWSNKTTLAAQRMQQKLEELRSSGALVSGEETIDDIALEWKMTQVSGHLRRVDITASWEEISAGRTSNTMTAFIKSDSL